MYINTLSSTGENILAFLLNNLNRGYAIRELAKAVAQDYKIVFTTTKKIQAQGVIKIERISNINRCSPNISHENAQLFGYVSQRYSIIRLPKKITSVLSDIKTSIKNPFYILLIFGSYAKGSATSRSDLDLLFIIPDRNCEPQINAAVKKSATLSAIQTNHIILTINEFISALREPSVAQEAYNKHLLVHGGELFYELIQNA